MQSVPFHPTPARTRRIRAAATLAAGMLLLTGCSSSPAAPASAPISAPATEAPFDPDGYPAPDEYSPAQLSVLADEQDARQLISMTERYPSFTRPAITRERFVLQPEAPEVWAKCLTDAGYPSTASDGGVSTDLPTGQLENEPWDTAYTACTLQYPIDPRYSVPPNTDQLTFLYKYYVHVATPCLEQLGESVSTPPSLTTFIADWGSGSSWLPHEDVSARTRNDTADQCPQIPTGFYGPDIAAAELSLGNDSGK